MKTRLLLVMALAALNFNFARAEDSISKELWQKTFDSDITSFSLSPDSDCAAATLKEVIYLDKQSETEKSYPLKEGQYAVLSANMKVFAVINHRPKAKDIIENLEIFNKAGDRLCLIKENGRPVISPDGNWLAAVNAFKNRISFYDTKGALLKKYDFEDIKGLVLSFSGDSRYCAVNVPNMGQGKTSGFMLLFDNKGNQLWRFDHPGSTIGEIAVSYDASRAVYASETELFYLVKGKLAWKQPLSPGGISAAISQTGKFAAIARRQDNSVSLFDSSGKLLWNKPITSKDLLGYNSPFIYLNVLDEATVIAAIARTNSIKNDMCYLYLLKDGEITGSFVYNQSWISVETDKTAENLLVAGRKKLFFYNRK